MINLTFQGWVIILLLILAISKTKIGNSVIFYSLLLVLILLLLGQYKEIQKIMIKGDS